MNHVTEHVVVGFSGGVDSSVAAALLIERGFHVTGLFMKNWEEDDDETCSAAEDLADAQTVADRLNIELRTVNFATEYWDRVFEQFLLEHRAGRTPNPDILCNREIKFKEFLDHAQSLGGARVATGHYVSSAERDGYTALLRGADRNKDQSYFLHALGQDALRSALFPIGEMQKAEVRAHARRLGLVTHDKRDSTGICFIGERPFREFLERYIPRQVGPIQTPQGREIGQHMGLAFYTLGQRQGLGIGGLRGADNSPWYVYEKDMINNVLGVVQGHDHPLLFSTGLRAHDANWVCGVAPLEAFRATVKTRYRQTDVGCTVQPLPDNQFELRFDQPQRAVTPGQSAVIYQHDECLGGGVINQTQALAASATHGLSLEPPSPSAQASAEASIG
jgi:tRNA-uridine 2-sulfurtransferase